MQSLLFLLFLVFINAFFAASEIALITLNDNKVKSRAEGGDKKSIKLMTLLGEPSKFLATIQVGITLAGFMASAFAAESYSESMSALILGMGVPLSASVIKTFSMVIITIVLSYFTLVLGELVPKRIAMKKSEEISNVVVGPLLFLMKATSPFVKLLTVSTNFFVRLAGIDPHSVDDNVTEEEIRMMIDVGEEKGTIHESEKMMINNIFEFNNKTASDIMTHRTDIVALDVESDLYDVVKLINEEKYSRIPVFEKTVDNVVGILHTKDMISFLSDESLSREFSLRKIIREPYFVPESKKTDELFRDLQRNKTPISIVIDEYGGTAGIATIEDLVEEIVGEILDEYDEEEPGIQSLEDGTYIIDGFTSLDEMEHFFETEFPIDEYDTLSGFMIGNLGIIPVDVDIPHVIHGDLKFTAIEVNEKTITRIKVERIEIDEDTNPSEEDVRTY
jgi:putative hemolysin